VSERSDFFNKGANSTLALMIYCALAVALIVIDRKMNYLAQSRQAVLNWVAPVWRLAEVPSLLFRAGEGYFIDRRALVQNYDALKVEYLRQQQELLALRSEKLAANRLSQLVQSINAQPSIAGGVFARVMALDFANDRNQLAINRGRTHGVLPGTVVLNELGLVGQVFSAADQLSTVILISDPKHRIPAQVRGGGERFYVAGMGEAQQLSIDQLAPTSRVALGDFVETSGLGGIFPEGIPIGRIMALDKVEGEGVLRASVAPAAMLTQLREVYLIAPVPAVGPLPATTLSAPNAAGGGTAQSTGAPQ
jgi:rod shape-determining protein MreC